MNDDVKQIRERITGFAINRIPQKELEWFIEFSKNEFCDDRGMALKHLINFYVGLIPSGIEHVESALNELEERLLKLEKQPEVKEEPKYKTMMDGSKRIEEKQNE